MEKVLLINKPKGPTSHDVVEKIREKYPNQKVGHAGTLDPLAEGLLIILVGTATKRQSSFMKQEKEYEVQITLGVETDTYDKEGEVVSKAPTSKLKNLNLKNIKKALEKFQGEIKQTVPPHSAVKIKGKRLFELARRGEINPKDLPVKKVTIRSIEILDFKPQNGSGRPKLTLRVICSSGTYIRSLAHDLGRALGTGAHLSSLRRVRIGTYKIKDAQEIQ